MTCIYFILFYFMTVGYAYDVSHDANWRDGLYKLEAADQILIIDSVHLYVILS